MSRTTSPATQRALEAVRRGTSAHAAALAEGISPSTIYRALAKQRKKETMK
jgi:transposase